MFKGMKDMGKLLKQAKDMQGKMKKVQKELAKLVITGTALNNLIKVVVTGDMTCVSIEVDDSLLNKDQAGRLQDGLKDAVNEAIKKSKETASSRISDISGGLDVPGLG
ncbi:MAG: YbaB/EbfC family nucleoid-associated protein [bacterium]|nr:YbaB/EbfC family nucleoid-associated protein [bacterium]